MLVVGHESGPAPDADLAAKIESSATLIDDARPHVLALQEVGDEPVLAELQGAPAWSMPHRASGVPDERGIRVAFLSKRVVRDPVDVTDHPGGLLPVQVGDDLAGAIGPETTNRMGRGELQIGVRVNHRIVRLVTCHLKSKLLSHPGGRFFPATRTNSHGSVRTRCSAVRRKPTREGQGHTRAGRSRRE